MKKFLGFLFLVLILFVGYQVVTSYQFGAHQVTAVTTEPNIKSIEVNGHKIAYIEQGAEHDDVVVIIHGYPDLPSSWADTQDALAETGFRVIAVYLPGYPPSDLIDDYSVENVANQMIGLMDALQIENAHFIGHDWGAIITYEIADEHKSYVNKIVAVSIPHPSATDPSVLLKANHFIYYQLPLSERLVWSYDYQHLDRIYKKWAPNYDLPDSERSVLQDHFAQEGAIQGALGYYKSFFAEGAEKAGPAATSRVTQDALIIAGDSDGVVDFNSFDIAAQAFDESYMLVTLENVGHFPHLEATDRTTGAIVKFLSSQ